MPRKVNANGFNGRINYQLDGSNNTESDRAGIRLIPISNSYVQEVQQVSNGFAPEFGNTVGTVFNSVTRRNQRVPRRGGLHFPPHAFQRPPQTPPAAAPTPEVNVDSLRQPTAAAASSATSCSSSAASSTSSVTCRRR